MDNDLLFALLVQSKRSDINKRALQTGETRGEKTECYRRVIGYAEKWRRVSAISQ